MVLDILQLPNPILRQTAKPVAKIDNKILKLVRDMTDTLKSLTDPKGVGLAAPQVGVSLRLFLVDINGKITPFINPEIQEVSKGKVLNDEKNKGHFLEGCLSLRKTYGLVNRHRWIRVRYQDINGKVHAKKYQGRFAEYIQHEMDHLGGKIFIDHTLASGYKLYRSAKNENGKEVLREIENI